MYRYTPTITAVAIATLTSVPVAAEDLVTPDLQTPPSPALQILGATSTAVERPSTPSAVAASLASAIQKSGGIPDNFGLEVAPYWLYSHPNLTFEDYYHPDLVQTLLQTASLSLATTRSETDDGTEFTRLASGIRVQLVTGGQSRDLKGAVASHQKVADEILRVKAEQLLSRSRTTETKTRVTALKTRSIELEKQIEATRSSIRVTQQRHLSTQEQRDLFEALAKALSGEQQEAMTAQVSETEAKLQQLADTRDETAQTLVKLESELKSTHDELLKSEEALSALRESTTAFDAKLEQLDAERRSSAQRLHDDEREGLEISLAAAWVWDFPGSSFDDGALSQWSSWATLAHDLSDAGELLLVVRANRATPNAFANADTIAIDVGGRLVADISTDLELSAEFLHRLRDQKDGNFRYAGVLEYTLLDNTSISFTFGRDFTQTLNPETGTISPLIALLALSLGLGKDPQLPL